jgi:hypothetical protein
MEQAMKQVTVNAEQRLYVIPCGAGHTSLGFDVAYNKALAVLNWIEGRRTHTTEAGLDIQKVGKIEGYQEYSAIMERGAEHARRTRTRCPAELTPRLIGLEGRRVEVTDAEGTRRFEVGKSTGWMPCHLEIARRDSSGGPAVYLAPNAVVKVVR